MKPFSYRMQSPEAVQMLTSQTGLPFARIEAAARAATARLDASDPPPPTRASRLREQVPEVLPTPPLRSLPTLRLRLSSGRSVRVRVPEAAARADLHAATRTAEHNAQRQCATLKRHASALDALQSTASELERRVRAVEAQADLALLAAVGGGSRTAEQLSSTVRRVEAQERTARALSKRVRFQARTAGVQRVQSAVSAMQVAAYGERGNVLAPNNLLLAGSELLWGSIDPLLRRLGLWSGAEPVPLTWLGPLLGLVVGHYTIGQQQFERVISGELTLRPIEDDLEEFADLRSFTFEGSLDLQPFIAPGYWDELRSKPRLPARAQISQGGVLGIVIAWVELGTLRVLALAEPEDKRSLEVAWSVDLEVGRG